LGTGESKVVGEGAEFVGVKRRGRKVLNVKYPRPRKEGRERRVEVVSPRMPFFSFGVRMRDVVVGRERGRAETWTTRFEFNVDYCKMQDMFLFSESERSALALP